MIYSLYYANNHLYKYISGYIKDIPYHILMTWDVFCILVDFLPCFLISL